MATQIDEIKFELENLRVRVEQMEHTTSCNGSSAAEELESIERFTRELFGSSPTFKLVRCPENGDAYVVVEVPATGSREEMRILSQKWHRFLVDRMPPTSSYSLSIQFQA
jgi:hypothetical protein